MPQDNPKESWLTQQWHQVKGNLKSDLFSNYGLPIIQTCILAASGWALQHFKAMSAGEVVGWVGMIGSSLWMTVTTIAAARRIKSSKQSAISEISQSKEARPSIGLNPATAFDANSLLGLVAAVQNEVRRAFQGRSEIHFESHLDLSMRSRNMDDIKIDHRLIADCHASYEATQRYHLRAIGIGLEKLDGSTRSFPFEAYREQMIERRHLAHGILEACESLRKTLKRRKAPSSERLTSSSR